jgi:hypothetical protein
MECTMGGGWPNGTESRVNMTSLNAEARRIWSLRSALVLFLLATCAGQLSGQCPPRPRIPDPPGWAIDTMGPGIYGYGLSEDGNWFGFNSNGTIWLLNVRTGEKKQLLPCIEVSADAIAFSPDSSTMVLGTGNGVIYLFDIPGGVLRTELRDDDGILHLKFAPSGLLLVTRPDGISIWNMSTFQRLARFYGGTCAEGGPCVWQYFDAAELNSNGRLIATSGRENSGIVVRDMEGRVALWVNEAKEQGSYLFLPNDPNALMVSTSDGFHFWDIRNKRVARRLPRHEQVALLSFLPNDLSVVVSWFQLPGTAQAVQRIDINSGKVLSSWNTARYIIWFSADGVWGTTQAREAIHLPTQRVAAELKYVPSSAPSVPWNAGYRYSAQRVLEKEPSRPLVVALFVLLGIFGYFLCRISKYGFLPFIASAFTLSLWWLRELWWPSHGPGIGRALGRGTVAVTVLSIAIAWLLPLTAILRPKPIRKNRRGERLVIRWGLPLISACLAASFFAVSAAQSGVVRQRYQVEGDVRAGGELRGSGLVPWYERNLPGEAARAIDGPYVLIACWLPERTQHLVPLAAAAIAFGFWSLVAAALLLLPEGKRRRRILLSVALAIVELLSAIILVVPYAFNPIYRAYTPTSLLLHCLLWTACVGVAAIFVFIDARRLDAQH